MESYGSLEDLKGLLDVETNSTVFYEQITNNEEDYVTPKINHFTELYNEYIAIFGDESHPHEVIEDITDQFTQLCIHIINYINEEFNTEVDVESLTDDSHNLPGVTGALYNFFIIDFFNNVNTILLNYVHKNIDTLYEEFCDLNQKKDIMSNHFKKKMPDNVSVIAANIYDITDFIFTKIDAETALMLVNSPSAIVLHKLVEKDVLNDEFIITIADIYKKNIPLRSQVCLNIVFSLLDKYGNEA